MIYERLLRPLFFALEPEAAHGVANQLAWLAPALGTISAARARTALPTLKTRLAGKELSNPLGLAAGFDKNGRLTGILAELGFGFEEVGSVTARACAGNAKPRLFRLPDDRALINRLGLNGDGARAVATRLSSAPISLPLGINIAKSNFPEVVGEMAIQDMLASFEAVKNLPVMYVCLNVSCPNTHEERMQECQQLASILVEIEKLNVNRLPLFIKLSPDSPDDLIAQITDLGRRHNVAGYVCGNTTTKREALRTKTDEVEKMGKGGLSGPPLKPLALKLCRTVYRVKDKEQQIIACGGISSGEDAYEFIKAGASAIQVYTALVYYGPLLPVRICEVLAQLLDNEGMTLMEAIGCENQKQSVI